MSGTQEQLLPETVLTRSLGPIQYSGSNLQKLVASIEEQPLYEYSNMRMNEIFRTPIPLAEICSLGKRIVPYLVQALAYADGMKKIRLAQALAMLESQAGVPVLIEEIKNALEGPELPKRTAMIMYVQLTPDHGAMPDTAYLLYSLAQAKDKRILAVCQRVVDLLAPTADDFKDSEKGIYYYVDAVCQGAERLGDPDAVPILEQLHKCPYLNGQQCVQGYQADYFLERRAMLELAIGRALARCGNPLGYEILIAYLADVRSPLSKHAWLELQRLSGEGFGQDPNRWKDWLAKAKPDLQPQPFEWRSNMEADSETILRDIQVRSELAELE